MIPSTLAQRVEQPELHGCHVRSKEAVQRTPIEPNKLNMTLFAKLTIYPILNMNLRLEEDQKIQHKSNN